MGLKVDKAPGPDNLHPRVLQEVVLGIVDPMVVIFQNILISGLLPTDWRAANGSPYSDREEERKQGTIAQ